MTAQIQSLQNVRLTDKAQQVYDCLLRHPEGLTYPEVATLTGLKERTVCGRMGDLKPLGLVWTESPKTGKLLAFATDVEGDIARNVQLYERESRVKGLASMKKGGNALRSVLTPVEVAQLRTIFKRLDLVV